MTLATEGAVVVVDLAKRAVGARGLLRGEPIRRASSVNHATKTVLALRMREHPDDAPAT